MRLILGPWTHGDRSLSDAGDVDFGLLVCEPALVPFYRRLGWTPHEGGLLVCQHGKVVPFTFNLPMTLPVQASSPAGL